MWRDIRQGLHILRANPLFTLAAVLALGVAIGANAAIFGLVDALWFRPPGVRDPGALVRVFSTTDVDRSGSWSFPEYRDIRDRAGALEDVIARGRRGAILPAPDGTDRLVLVNVVSINFFSALGVRPHLGRLFAPGDEPALEANPGVVLGYAFWVERFGGDPSIVGRSIDLGRGQRLRVTVLGVLPERFRDLEAAADRDIWIPTTTWAVMNGREEFERRQERWFDVMARLKRSTSLEAARDEVGALATSMARDSSESGTRRGARVVSELAWRLESGGVNALALLGLVALVVLITCVNVANLLLARAAARSRELAVRIAIGATRWRLLRQLMTESALLGVLGAMAGLTMAMWLIRLMPALLVPPPGFRSFLVFETDARVLLFTALVTLLTTVLFGVAPSWTAARTDVAPLINVGARDSASSTGRLTLLVTMQIAVSLVLLAAAGVLVRSFVATERADLGFARKPVLTAWATSGDVNSATAEEARRQLAGLPGVTNVALAIRAPLSLSGGGLAQPVYLPGHPPPAGAGLPEIKFNAVSANYFAVLGIPLVRGRLFDAADERPGEPVVIVNERFASEYFPGRDAVGEIVRPGGSAAPPHRIAGVVRNTVINQIGEEPEPYFYLPYLRGTYGEVTFLLDSAADSVSVASAARAVLARLDRRLQPRLLITMREYIDYSTSTYQATATLALLLGAVGLLLTSIGVYGVMAYRTTRRTREIGIRIALGAARGQVVGMVLREGARVAILGLALGIPSALVATRALSSMLFGIGPWDLTSFAVATTVLAVTVAGATLIPAWRATRVDPSEALRNM
jgi:putative ABC transport system permease protein